MQAQATLGIWEILFWIVAGSGLLGLPPGERDPALLKTVPAKSVLYFEWAARGQGQQGAAGIDGLAADPEILQFTQLIEAELAKHDLVDPHGVDETTALHLLRPVLPQIIQMVTAHPGCVFASFDAPRQNNPGAAGLLAALTSLQGGIILSSGHDTDALWKSLNKALEANPDFHFDERSPTQSIPVAIPGYKLVIHREGARILIALGESTLPRIIEGLSGRQPGLDSNPRFQQSFNRVAVPRFSTAAWVDGNGIISGVTSAIGPLGLFVRPLLNMVGVDALDHLVQSSGVDRGTMIHRTFISTGGRTDGVMVLAAGVPIQPEQFAHIPADADLVMATSISLTRVFQESRQLLVKAQPLSVRVFDEAVKQLQTELELRIVEDVLPAFGDVVMAFDSPGAGGMIATSLIVSLEVKDAPKAAIVFDRLMKLIEQSLSSDHNELDYGESASLRRQEFLGKTICYVHSNEGSHPGGFSITPTFCLTGQHLLFAVHPQAMKAQLRYQQSKLPGFDQQAGRRVAVPLGEPLTYAYLDGPRASNTAGLLLPYLGHTLVSRLSEEGISLDAFAIPSAAAIVPYIGDSTAVITRQTDGLFIETKNGPPVVVALVFLSIYRAQNSNEFELLDVRRRRQANEAGQAQLGPAENGVVPAVAEKKEAVPGKVDSNAFGKLAPIFLKALIPDDLQQIIPESALRQLGEGPSPASIQRREEMKRKREERRQRRLGPMR